MLIILFDKQNLIHKESELEGKTKDSEFHGQVVNGTDFDCEDVILT
jgi:hypothetical protein